MRRTLLTSLAALLLTACIHTNDRQVIGSGDAAFPLASGTKLYWYWPTQHLLTQERAAELSGSDVRYITSVGATLDQTNENKDPQSSVATLSGHCYRVFDDTYLSFAVVRKPVYLASMGSKGCLEAGAAGKHQVMIVQVRNGEIRPLTFKGKATLANEFEAWAKDLNFLQRFWYGIDLTGDGKVSVDDSAAYIAFVEDRDLDNLVELPDLYYFSSTPPSADQLRAAKLIAAADAQARARQTAAAQALPPAQAAPPASRSGDAPAGSPLAGMAQPSGRLADFDPGDVVVLETGFGWQDVQVVTIRQEYPQIKVRHIDNGRIEWVAANQLKTADQIRHNKGLMGLTLLCAFSDRPGECAQEMARQKR